MPYCNRRHGRVFSVLSSVLGPENRARTTTSTGARDSELLGMTNDIVDGTTERVRSCPLCGSDTVRLLQRIRTEDLARLVAQSIGSDAGRECTVIETLVFDLDFKVPR